MSINLEDHLDADHLAVLELVPGDLFDLSDLPAARARLDAFIALMPAPEIPDSVEIADHRVEAVDGHEVLVRVYRPAERRDRNETPSSSMIDDNRVWNRDANIAGWSAYLDGNNGADDVPYYAAPARATDLGGLPPAIITVGSLDMFLDEDIAYARALLGAGVPCELHVYPGAFHGSKYSIPHSDITRRWHRDEMAALGRALNG